MNKICIFLIFLLSLSCTGTGQRKQPESEIVEEKKLSKLELLMLLPRDSVMDYYGLSKDSITDFPNLSDYTIKSLDLSYNRLETVIVDYLPKEIVTLNLSNNLFRNFFRFSIDDKLDLPYSEKKKLYHKSTIREIDLSHNSLTRVLIGYPLRKLILSYNDMTYVEFSHFNIEYLDISNNPNLSNVVQFAPNEIDTIIRHNIANDKALVPSNRDLPHIDYIFPDDSIK